MPSEVSLQRYVLVNRLQFRENPHQLIDLHGSGGFASRNLRGNRRETPGFRPTTYLVRIKYVLYTLFIPYPYMRHRFSARVCLVSVCPHFLFLCGFLYTVAKRTQLFTKMRKGQKYHHDVCHSHGEGWIVTQFPLCSCVKAAVIYKKAKRS